jgi:UDP-GlcNAc:undecaprenyl-phosphate GlcNAc-1-phosphate transferase
MSFPFNLYLAALISAFITSFILFPVWKRWCERAGHMDDPGHRKIHLASTPLAGGLTVMSGFFAPIMGAALILELTPLAQSAFGASFTQLLSHGLSRRAPQLLAISGGAFGMMLLGWFDDHYELTPGKKFMGQALIASAVAASGIRITVFIPSPLVNWAVTVFWVLTVTNAFNFTDNMNGLCAGLGISAAWSCGWAAAIHGQFLAALLSFLICGALAGFFPFNFPRAFAFLGDSGSQMVGFLAAVLSIMPDYYSRQTPHKLAVFSPLFFLAIPLLDLLCVVIYRWRIGQPVYVGDNNHFSHRLARRGFSKTSAVLILLFANTVSAALPFFLFYR